MSNPTNAQREATSGGGKIPLGVFTLGIISFLTDVSSEAIFAVLPIYFISIVGGTTLVLGIMEGLADFAGSSLDLTSGYAMDEGQAKAYLADLSDEETRATAIGIYGFVTRLVSALICFF